MNIDIEMFSMFYDNIVINIDITIFYHKLTMYQYCTISVIIYYSLIHFV